MFPISGQTAFRASLSGAWSRCLFVQIEEPVLSFSLRLHQRSQFSDHTAGVILQALKVLVLYSFVVSPFVGCDKAFMHGADRLIESSDLLIIRMKRCHVPFLIPVSTRCKFKPKVTSAMVRAWRNWVFGAVVTLRVRTRRSATSISTLSAP